MGDGRVRYPPAAGGARAGTRRPGKSGKRSARGRARSAPAGKPAATYWRRRFVVLSITLAALGAGAGSLSNALTIQSGHGPPATTSYGEPRAGKPGGGGANESGAARQGGGAANGQGGAGANVGRAAQAAAGSSGSASDHGSGSPSANASAPAGHASGTPSPGASGGPGPLACPLESIVLSLRQVKAAGGGRPAFDVSVVSTQQANCSFN
ncbi:MAG: hypothetical protein LBV34_01265, partial [Nocardiopsaceae bacterium]|nr:hypothetical protein [Nocardiopsaceae bacterium]